MTKTNNVPTTPALTVRAEVPFCGFYESAASAFLEDCLESEVHYLVTGGAWPLDKEYALEKIRPLISEETFAALRPLALDDWETYEDTVSDKAGECVEKDHENRARFEIATCWVRDFGAIFEARYGVDLSFDLSSLLLISPPYYNFETDRIVCRASVDALKTLLEENRAEVAAYGRRVLEPRDGFAPFFSPNIEEWGDCEEWNAAQWGFVLEALTTETIEDELRAGIYENDCYTPIDYEGLFRAVLETMGGDRKAA